ncbi:MAG: hypothetical protein IKF07_05315 [Eubacterium sp.]|nr:hypothetical protein [Eubacterium sp.]
MKMLSRQSLYKVITIAVTVLLALCLAVSCADKKAEPEEEPKEETIEYKANSPLGVAESYIGKDVKGLIEAVGTLKSDPVIKAANDGGGYEGTYEFDGFTVHTYAKAEDAESIVTEVIPDENSEVYKESIKTDNNDDGAK